MSTLFTDTTTTPAARTRPTRPTKAPADAMTATTGFSADCGVLVVEWIELSGVRLEVSTPHDSAAQHRVRMALASLRDAVNDHRLTATIEREDNPADTADRRR